MVQDKRERDGHQTSATAQCNLEEEKLTQARNTSNFSGMLGNVMKRLLRYNEPMQSIFRLDIHSGSMNTHICHKGAR